MENKMQTLYLKRGDSTPDGTFGAFYDENNNQLCYSLELPWNDNQPDISSIPTGNYIVVDYESPSKGLTWLLQNVPGRSEIEIHSANLAISQLKGCIAPGLSLGDLDGIPAVLQSKEALEMLRSKITAPFTLIIN